MDTLRKQIEKEMRATWDKLEVVKSKEAQDNSTYTFSIDETNEDALLNAEYGPQQVKSLLHLVVNPPNE